MEIPFEEWLAWNPALTEDCGNFKIGYSYCIEVAASNHTSGGPPTPTSTSTPNGIVTPSPILGGMADNCYKFHKVKTTDTCDSIVEENNISERKFHGINPYIGNDCTYLPEGTNVCVGTFDQVPGFKHHGCYSEAYVGLPGSTKEARALDHLAVGGQSALTLEWCAVYCMEEKKKPLFGVEFGKQCWCGVSLNMGSTKTPAKDCSNPCSGNGKQTCGGPDRLNVYGSKDSSAPVSYRPWGCYTEGTNTRALGDDSLWANDMTIEKCADYCLRDKGTTHFNVQNSIECWCGNNLGLGSIIAPSADCSGKCAGNKNQNCGSDAGRLNLFSSSFTQPPMKFKNLGCHTELESGRALPNANTKNSKGMTIEKCGKYCIGKGYKTFGAQNAIECWCGSKLDAGSKKAPEAECKSSCPGNTKQKCGGSKRLSVYQWSE
ncbi:hypothetical protein ACO1O0_000126 [Amphichorda felina]